MQSDTKENKVQKNAEKIEEKNLINLKENCQKSML